MFFKLMVPCGIIHFDSMSFFLISSPLNFSYWRNLRYTIKFKALCVAVPEQESPAEAFGCIAVNSLPATCVTILAIHYILYIQSWRAMHYNLFLSLYQSAPLIPSHPIAHILIEPWSLHTEPSSSRTSSVEPRVSTPWKRALEGRKFNEWLNKFCWEV